MSIHNQDSKKFRINLGTLLQQSAQDLNACIVKLSQPHIHRSTGPMFKLGSAIVDEMKLTPASHGRKKHYTSSDLPQPLLRRMSDDDDVEPSDDEVRAADSSTSRSRRAPVNTPKRQRRGFQQVHSSASSPDTESDEPTVHGTVKYRHKKQMSASIFGYVIQANDKQQKDMGLYIDEEEQMRWSAKLAAHPTIKLDDIGEALLHALDERLCSGSSYRQLAPVNSSLQANRTVVVCGQPTETFWVVLHRTCNAFVLEHFGTYRSGLEAEVFHRPSTVAIIKQKLERSLRIALTDVTGKDIYCPVDHIKIIAKQLKGRKLFSSNQADSYAQTLFTDEMAGCLTRSAVTAFNELCTESVGQNSQLCERKDKILGALYIQTNVQTGHKFQVIRSSGKHTNAMLACMHWMTENTRHFVESRMNLMAADEKLKFYLAIEETAGSSQHRLEMLELSDKARQKIISSTTAPDSTKSMLADLILIGINKNQQHVKSVAANYRQITPRYPSTLRSKSKRITKT